MSRPASAAASTLAEVTVDRSAGGQRAASSGVVKQVLPHTRKALLTLRDENGEDVSVTVSLEGAEWEYEDAGAVFPEFVEMKRVCFLAATFPNGNRYVFGERIGPDQETD